MTSFRQSSFAELIRLGVIEIGDGYRATLDELGGDGLPFLRSVHIKNGRVDLENVDRFRVTSEAIERKTSQVGDVVIVNKGSTVGKVAQICQDLPKVVYSPQTCYWRSLRKDVVDPVYLRHWAGSSEFSDQLDAMAGSTDMAPYLNLRDQQRLIISIPSIDVQREAASLLDVLDRKIELNRRTCATLDEMARALFKNWFVDVEVNQSQNSAAKPNQQYSFERPVTGNRDEWKVMPLYDMAKFVNGNAYGNDDFVPKAVGLPVVKIAELTAGLTSQTRYASPKSSQTRLQDGDILLSWSGNPDTSIGVFVWCDGPAILNQHIFKVSFSDSFKRAWGLCLLKDVLPRLIECARDKQTTGLGHFTVADMKRLTVLRPPDSVIQAFHEKADPLVVESLCLRKQSRTLAELRDTLLPKLLSGELRIRDAEKAVGEAT